MLTLFQLSGLSPQGGQLSPVAVSVLPQLGQLCSNGRRGLLRCPGLADQCTSSLSNCEFQLHVSDGVVQLGVLGLFWAGGLSLLRGLVSSGTAGSEGLAGCGCCQWGQTSPVEPFPI